MRRRCNAVMMAAALCAILWLTVSAAPSGGRTAKAGLVEAVKAGRKWQKDAVLVSLSALPVRLDGTADEWKYSFYSPGSGKRCVVTATRSGVRAREVRAGYSTEPLGNFIDSDQAMWIARSHGLEGNEPDMAVKFQGTGKKAAAYWIVNGGLDKGDVTVFLEAGTGAFSSSSVME